MESEAPTEELCAVHTDRAAGGTCLRCGTFMCEECRAPELTGHCASCAERLANGRFVAQVPILSIVMIVHGVLTGGMGLYHLVLGGFFAANLAPAGPQEDPGGDLFAGMFFGALGLLAIAHLVPGALQIWAGWRARTFRSRPLAFVALGVGLLTVIGCYCAPSAVGLLVWGLVVLTSDDVRDRFAAQSASDT